MKVIKIVVIVLISLIFTGAGALFISYLLSNRSDGRSACERLSIPYRAVIAHRGLSYLAPEETWPAYILARDVGADYLEGDIQRTRDGALIMLHDDSLKRTTDVARIFPGRENDPIYSFTLSEIKRLDAGSWFNHTHPERARKGYAGLKILTLDELIDIAESGKNKPGLYLETKDPKSFPGIENNIVQVLKKRGWIDAAGKARGLNINNDSSSDRGPLTSVIFQSFDKDSLAALKKLAPGVPAAYLIDRPKFKKKGWAVLLKETRELDAAIGPVGYIANPVSLGRAHRQGILNHIYTVDKGWQFTLLTIFGADGFFTNRCDRLLNFYGRRTNAEPRKILNDNGFGE